MLKSALKGFLAVLLTPLLLIGGCAGKMSFDAWRYNLPGEVLKSSAPPTHSLQTPLDVAKVLDSYVQPRFEILRDRNFGALRIVYRKHAGIVQLKVDTAVEKEKIANVNAAHRDYAISLLHCADVPDRSRYSGNSRLQTLYINQKPIANSGYHYARSINREQEKQAGLDGEAIEKKAIAVLPKLMRGQEQYTETKDWGVLMRPVLAAKQECLDCHTTAKRGDTLGVMVYAIRKTARKF